MLNVLHLTHHIAHRGHNTFARVMLVRSRVIGKARASSVASTSGLNCKEDIWIIVVNIHVLHSGKLSWIGRKGAFPRENFRGMLN